MKFFTDILKRVVATTLLPILFLTVYPSNLAVMADEAKQALSPTPGELALGKIKPRHTASSTFTAIKFSLPTNPTTQDLRQARLFTEPLFPVGGKASDADNSALAAALTKFATGRDRTVMESYIAGNPKSPWLASVLANVGMLEFQDGYFSTALSDYQQAWSLGKNETDRVGKLVIDRAVAELIKMYCRVGQTQQAESLLAEVKSRPFQGMVANMMHNSVEATRTMDHHPNDCFKCGPFALGSIMSYQKQGTTKNTLLLKDYRTTKQGVSLSAVQALSAKMGLRMQMARRVSGSAIPLPAVVHWKLNHYGALLSQKGDRYLLADPTFGQPALVLADAVDKETDGYFLVPAGNLPPGWVSVGQDEGSKVFGRGWPTGEVPQATTKHDPKTCPVPPQPGAPLAAWSFHIMLTSLHIQDTPVGYTPPLGPDMHLTVTYDHREMNQPSVINYSNFGPLWNFNWMSTVTVAPTITSVGEGTGGSALYLAGWHNGALPPEADRDTNAYIQYSVNYPSSYEVDNKDGSTMVYGLEDTAGVYYLTQIVDPKGKSTTMTYYTGTTRLQYVTDALGQQTTFQYQSDTVGDPGYYLITGVTDPFGRTATFTYSSGELASITDAAGNLSQFTYGSNAASTVYPDSFISKLQTPYGTTCFSYTLSDDGNIRTLTANEPNNAKQMIIGVADANAQWSSVPEPWTLPASQVPSSGNFYNGYMNFRNSFYWDRKAMSMDPGDWQSAHIYHFFHDVDTGPTSEVVEAEKPALENWIWYAYQGEAPDAISLQDGEFNNVTQIGRTLDSGATQLTQYNYNSSGNKTQSIDPLGRTTSINYESNGIDVQNIQQVNGANTDTLAAYTWNSNHEPLTTTDAAGEQTQYSYYSNTQLESVTDPLGETTTFNYTSGYLTSIQGPDPSSLDLTTLGYANGSGSATNNVTSTTNGEGYELKYAYDNLDRVTQITYPNGNSDQYAYTTLDLTQTTDRMGHTTNYTYNGLDQKTSMTDANGDTTQYGWCSCGSLKSITDGNGHVTRWNQDVEGRTISKTYADGTQELTSYEGATDRVHSVKDAKGQLKVYAYNADDSLASVTYVNAQNPTAPVKFGYDPAYRRITSMQDGIGVTSYTYNPVASGGASPGGGRVAQVTGPWSNSTVQYSYDQLGRVLSRAINGVAQSYQYDVLGRINQVNNDVLGTFSYTFQDDSNRVTAISVPNGEQIKYTYLSNEFNRWLSEIQNLQPPNTNVSTFNYSHQADGAVSSWKQKIGTPQTTYTLGYDNTDELTSASATGSNYGYTYDAGGNRLTETINGSTTTATCNAVNEIQQITPAKPGDKTYQWDAEDRLVGIGYTGTGQQTKLSYDGEGRCAQIQELNNGTVTSTRRFLWCGMERCEERDGYDNMTKRFFTQGEEIAGQPYYFLKDHLGSVWEMTDAGRNIRASYKYDFYGRRTKVSGDLDADFGFTGLFYHQLSQLSLAVYREYDPNTGRWLSRDPYRDKFGNSAELALGPNVYQYVSNSPILSTDPLGLWSPLRRGGGWFYPGHCPPQYTGPDRDKQMAPYVVGLLSLVLFAPFAAWDAALADGTAYTADAGAFLPPVAGTGVSQADIDAAIEALDENIAPDEWDFPE